MAKVLIIDGNPAIFCPACGCYHYFPKKVKPEIPGWTWNGDMDKPTFTPSMVVRVGPFPDSSKYAGQIRVCHSVVSDGKITYLHDCSHNMKGQTVEIPDEGT